MIFKKFPRKIAIQIIQLRRDRIGPSPSIVVLRCNLVWFGNILTDLLLLIWLYWSGLFRTSPSWIVESLVPAHRGYSSSRTLWAMVLDKNHESQNENTECGNLGRRGRWRPEEAWYWFDLRIPVLVLLGRIKWFDISYASTSKMTGAM